MRLCGATFLVFNGFQLVASFSYFIIVFYMYNGSYEMAGTVPALFSILGITYGGDGSTTFALPNFTKLVGFGLNILIKSFNLTSFDVDAYFFN